MRHLLVEHVLLFSLAVVAGCGSTTTSDDEAACSVEVGAPRGNLWLTVVNETAQPIYFEDDLCGGPVVIAFDALPSARLGESGCRAVPLDCTPDRAIPIEPGGQTSFSWQGVLVEPVPTPEGCVDPGSTGPFACFGGVAPAAGTMGTASFYFRRSCDDPSTYTTCSDQDLATGTFTYEAGAALRLRISEI